MESLSSLLDSKKQVFLTFFNFEDSEDWKKFLNKEEDNQCMYTLMGP